MGVNSRKKRERREDPISRGLKAEVRGRKLGVERSNWEAALARRGPVALHEGLISRANQRWSNLESSAQLLATAACHSVSRCIQVDWLLHRLGCSLQGHPARLMGGLGHIRWTADNMASFARLAMTGGFVGAAAVARSQIERWTLDLARLRSVRNEGEMEEYMARCWAPYRASPHWGWSLQSEILHGRGHGVDAALWEASGLMEPGVDAGYRALGLVSTVSLSLDLTIAHVWTLLSSHALGHGVVSERTALGDWHPPDLASFGFRRLWIPALWPLNLANVASPPMDELRKIPRLYENTLSAINSWPPLVPKPSQLASLAYLSRRGRFVETAAIGFENEKKLVGERFQPEALMSRELLHTQVCEMAGLAALWGRVGDPCATSLAVAASAIRSSFLLWLEDDPQSMICLRTGLEATARARAWRMKPAKAELLAARGSSSTPRDWMDAAGWRRLGLLVRSLGDFAHVTERTFNNLEEAYEILNRLQMAGAGGLATARGHALGRVTYLLAVETREYLKPLSLPLADAFAQLVGEQTEDDAEANIEKWFNHALGLRQEFQVR